MATSNLGSVAPNSQQQIKVELTQAAHGFVVGDWLYHNGVSYVKARADVETTADAVGVVSQVLTANTFVLTTGGLVTGLSGLTAGSAMFLSPTTAGTVQDTAPTTIGHVNKPVMQAISANSGYVEIDRGVLVVATAVEAGAVSYFARSTAPTGWLKANGAAVSRTAYATLFAAIGTTFGVGDGSTTFNLPDARGEFLRGWDDGRGVDTARVFGSFQDASHVAGDSDGIPAVHTIIDLAGANFDPPDVLARDVHFSQTGAGIASTSGSIYWGRVRTRNLAMLACIKY